MADLMCPDCEWPTVIGNEVRGVYDGVLFWTCARCGFAWPRDFIGYGIRLKIAAKDAADRWNRIPHRDKEELSGRHPLDDR